MEPQWLDWAKRLQALAQNGLAYAESPFDEERYSAVRGIAAEIVAHHADISAGDILELFSREEGYATPKIDVRGAVFRDDSLLLVRERSDGLWTLPGGWADVCESPGENVVKEIREESGFMTRAVRFLAVYDRSKHPHTPLFPFHVYKMFFLCEIIGGEPKTSMETADIGFFAEDNIPPLSLTRVLPEQIARMFEYKRHPDQPAYFD